MIRVFVLLLGGVLLAPAAGPLAPVDEPGYRALIGASRGSVVLVDFWATWCVPCRDEMPQLVRLAGKYRPRGLKFVTISCDEPEQESGAAAFLDKNSVPQPRYMKRAKDDDKFINSVDPKWSGALPALYIYDRQGRLVKAFVGETDMDALKGALRKAL